MSATKSAVADREMATPPSPGQSGGILAIVGLMGFSFAIFAWLSTQGFSGPSAVGAERVLNGEIPYRDFWTIYAPGQFYLQAALFAIFGHDAAVGAIAGSLLSAATVGLVFRLIWRITGRPSYALAGSLLLIGAYLARGYYGGVHSYTGVMFFLLVALNFLHAYFDRRQRSFLIAAGLAAGVAAWFKHDVAAYGTLAMLAGLAAYSLAARDRLRPSAGIADLLSLGLAATLAVLPVVLAVAILAGQEAFQDIIVFPATKFPYGRPESYPSLLPVGLHDAWLVQLLLNWSQYLYFAIPFLVLLASLPVVAAMIYRRQTVLAGFGTTFAVFYLFHYSAAHVQINTHIISMTLYAAGLAAVSLAATDLWRRVMLARWIKSCALVITVAWLCALLAQPIYNRLGRDVLVGSPVERAALSLPKAAMVRLEARFADQLAGLVRFVQERVPPGQPVFVGQHRHDFVMIGWPYIYFLLDRPPATRYVPFEPAVVDTAPVQEEMVRDLISKDVELLVLVRVFDDEELDRYLENKRRDLPEIGATVLDEFIRSNYEQTKQFGIFNVWLRKAS